MKKLVCFLLVVILMLSFVACGNDNQSTVSTSETEDSKGSIEPTNGNNEDVTTPSEPADNMEYANGFEWWGMKKVNAPEITGLTWETIKITEDVSRKVATTPFNVDAEELWRDLCGNNFLKASYKPLSYTYDEDIRFYVKDYPFFSVKETISAGGISSSQSSVNITLTQDLENYSNISGISMYFYEPEGFTTVDGIQDNVYSVVKSVYGDYADLLVYGKDVDGKRYNGDSWYNQSFSEVIDFGDYAYCFERHIDNQGTKIEFNVWIWNRTGYNDGIWHGIPKESVYYIFFPVGFGDVLPQEFGSTNPFNSDTFGNKWLGQFNDYKFTNVTSMNVTIRKHISGENEYFAGVGFNYSNGSEDKLGSSYSFYVKEQDGSLVDAQIGFSVGDFPKNGSDEDTFNSLKNFVSVLIKDTDLSELVYVEGERYIFERVHVSVLGFSNTEKIQVGIDDEFKFILHKRFT